MSTLTSDEVAVAKSSIVLAHEQILAAREIARQKFGMSPNDHTRPGIIVAIAQLLATNQLALATQRME